MRRLLDWAVRAELLLGSIARRERSGAPPVNRDYLASAIRYEDGRLMDKQGAGAPLALLLLPLPNCCPTAAQLLLLNSFCCRP